ncbi:MAG: cell division protein ZapA [candidate division WOR-3 bacterium]|nr:cell division protein ZapA [candidate division WOR-3 bacterium]MCX7948037.1 cell division protein ZapA [candidate division WOR-3 bacterium]MDW8151066.1 cell division protein ZapA [candidate division WOR-3 bacterium]
MKVEFEIFGSVYNFKIKVENQEELDKIKKIIEEVSSYIEEKYKSLPRDRKIALLVLLLSHRILQKEKKIEKLHQMLKDYETALNFVENLDES